MDESVSFDLVARRHHLHWRILQECREAYLRQGRVSEGSGPSLQRENLDGNARRAIDIHEGEEVDKSAFKALVRQAAAFNSSGKSKPSKKAKSLRGTAPEQVRHPGGGGVVPPERTQVEDGLDSRKERIV